MTDCEKIQELISCLMDGELTAKEKLEVESHIAHCPQCRAMYEDFAAISGMFSDETAQVPAALHSSIMESVNAAPRAKKKKGLLVALRPYMGAAACLVIIVGLVAMMRGGRGFDSAASNTAASTPASAPAAESYSTPAAANDNAPAGYSLEDTETADEPAEAPAEAEEAESGSDNYGGTGNVDYGFYAPGDTIDEAILTTIMTDGSRESLPLTELDKLSEALMPTDFSDPYGAKAIASAELSILSDGEWYTLELCYAGEALIVRQAEGYYFAAATVEEFLEIK